MKSQNSAPQATPRRVAVALARAYALLLAAIALLTWAAWTHHAPTAVGACIAIGFGLVQLYYAAVARGVLR